MMDINEILMDVANKGVQTLAHFGHMPGGHNGPYYDPETPVRNTAHWVTIFAYCYEKTSDEKFLNAIETCGNYLVSQEARPMNASFYCRTNPKKDFSNGTIGQAWVIEGLVSAFNVTGNQKYIDLAVDVFLLHPFDDIQNLWRVVNVDGSHRNFDMTFNHQLWFAASGYILLAAHHNDEILRQCNLFMNNLDKICRLYPNGLIKHAIQLDRTKKESIKNIINNIQYKINVFKLGPDTRYKENGYHLFNIYAFALIKDAGFSFPFFETDNFKQALNYSFSSELFDWLESKAIKCDRNIMPHVKNTKINIYGFTYNAPGFELPLIYSAFKDTLPDHDLFIQDIKNRQLSYTYDESKKTFNKNTEDEYTLTARLYELARSF